MNCRRCCRFATRRKKEFFASEWDAFCNFRRLSLNGSVRDRTNGDVY